MPDWWARLPEALKLSVPPSVVAAFFLWYIRLIVARHKIRRETKQDEVAVLHGQLKRLDGRCQRLEEELRAFRDARDKEVAELKSELTAALIENGTLRTQEKFLIDRNKELVKHNRELEERVEKLEAEVADLRTGKGS